MNWKKHNHPSAYHRALNWLTYSSSGLNMDLNLMKKTLFSPITPTLMLQLLQQQALKTKTGFLPSEHIPERSISPCTKSVVIPCLNIQNWKHHVQVYIKLFTVMPVRNLIGFFIDNLTKEKKKKKIEIISWSNW